MCVNRVSRLCVQCATNVPRGDAALREDGKFYCQACDKELGASEPADQPSPRVPPKAALRPATTGAISQPVVSFPDDDDSEDEEEQEN